MPSFLNLTWVNLKLYVREPVATFFTLAFPPLMVLLFGGMYGNEPSALFGGLGPMDISMPAYTAMILATVAFIGVPITLGAYREAGVLRRYKATALRPFTYILSDVVSNLLMTLVGMVGLVLVGWLLYRVHFQGNILVVIAAVVFCGLAMFAVGYLIASVAPNARTAQVVSMVIFYPMLFLSGAAIPLEIMPATIKKISSFLPLTYVVKLLRGLWFGDWWGEHLLETAVLAAILVLGAALSARFFRWE
ncbi:MAG TPA: ABC transporter permease [Anaerolineae bacterium]|nr:ABC transporter permease [Anaerolineae bacterium]